MKSLLLIIFLTGISSAQQLDDSDLPLVKIGNITITKSEFLSRYELTPGIQRRKNDVESNKGEFLLSMIAEKLLVLKAQQEGWDNDTILHNAVKEIEGLLVRDELYRREVQRKISISEMEKNIGASRSSQELKVYFLVSQTKENAEKIFAQIQKGKPLESFSHSANIPFQFDGLDSAMARWGDMDERMEDVIYRLKLNETSNPFQLDDGWYIVKIMGKTITVVAGEQERRAQMEKVESVLRRRKEQKRMMEFMSLELKSTKAEINARMLKSVLVHLWNIAQQRFPMNNDSAVFIIDSNVESEVRSLLSDSLTLDLITFPHTRWSVEKTVGKIVTSNLGISSPTAKKIRVDVEQRIHDLIDQEHLVQSGYKRGLHQSSSVQKELKVWRDAFLSQMVKNRMGDTVSVTQQEVEELKYVYRNDSSVVRTDALAQQKTKELKRTHFVDQFVGSIANNNEITFYEKNFSQVQVSTVNSMVYRYLGFGGRMFAVPFVVPQLGWINYWHNKDVKLP